MIGNFRVYENIDHYILIVVVDGEREAFILKRQL